MISEKTIMQYCRQHQQKSQVVGGMDTTLLSHVLEEILLMQAIDCMTVQSSCSVTFKYDSCSAEIETLPYPELSA